MGCSPATCPKPGNEGARMAEGRVSMDQTLPASHSGCRLSPRPGCRASAEPRLLESALGEMCAGELHWYVRPLKSRGHSSLVLTFLGTWNCVAERGW